MAILAADFKLAEGALANLDNFAKGIAKTGTASEKSQSQLKSATTGLKEFVAQVKALQTPFQQMIALSEKGGKEWVKYKAALKEASVGAKQLQADYVHLISAGGSWKATLDGIYSSQARSIINSKAEVVAAQNLEATFNKQIATRAQIIGLKNGSTQASLRALAVDEAELAITKAKYAADVNSAKQLAVNTILASNETLEIKRQALALAGIPPIKMAVVKATEVLTVAETGYTAAAVKSAAQATKQGMALELLSAQSKKRSALLSQLNALENGYAASLAKSLAPLQARVALSQAKNAADINLAKQIVLNTILASNETLEIKRQALALAGIPPIKMAVAKATQAMAVSSTESAAATNAASTAAHRGTGAFTAYGSAIRGAAGAMGKLWFAYGQILPLMAAFATVSATLSSFKAGTEFEYTVKMIQTLSKDVEGAEVSVADLNEELLHMEGLRHGPLELAKGMKEFAKAGVAPKDALQDLATMSKFATIAEMDLGEAIKRVIGLTLAFKPTMEAATGELFTFADAANMTAAAAMLTITDVDEMADAFAYAAELGVVSGMKFQEVAAALGIMANAGIRGTKGATSLRMGMIKLQTATDPVLKRIGDLTEEFTGIRKEFNAFHDDHSQKNIIEIFRDLNEVLKGLPDKERVAIFTDLFTARSLRAGAVISQQVEELESFIKKLEEAAEGVGFIEEKYQDLAQTAKAEWDFMKVAFQQMMLAFSVEGLGTDVIGDLLSGITAGIKEMTPAMQELGSVLGSSLKTVMEISKELVIVIKELNKFAIGGLPLGDLGLIGYILFRSSPQAAAIVAFLWAINEALKVFGKDAKSTVDSLKKDYGDLGTIIEQSLEVLQGKRDWNTGALKSTEGLAVVHERFKALDDTLAVSHEPIVSSLTAISDALEAFYGYEDIDIKVRISATISAEAQALLDKLFPEIKDKREFDQAKETLENLNLAGYFKDMPGGYEEALKRLKESTPEFQEQKKAIEESNRAIKAHNDEIQGIVYKYLPLKKEAEDVKTAQTFLNEAFEKGYINAEELASALDAVKKSTTAYRTEQEKLAEIE
ncbi:MAG: phage tail tape measure protein, partial [Candidatus Neomarinimicrobiota bacterium]